MNPARVAYIAGGMPRGTSAVELFDALGVSERLRQARTIFIKLNLCAAQRYDSGSGVCVNTRDVVALVEALREVVPGSRIQVGDSDSTGHGFAHDKFEHQDLLNAGTAADFQVIDLTRDRTVLQEGEGEFFPAVPLAKTVADADFFVSFGKIKTHNITRVSGVLKNDFGLLPHGEKKKLHPYLDSVLADIYMSRPPDLCVLDGRPAMAGNGPIHGDPIDTDLVQFGTDALATDQEMCRLMGIPPDRVSHLRHLACRLGRSRHPHAEHVGAMAQPEPMAFGEIPWNQRCLIRLGLKVQALGANIEELGNLVHFARKIGDIRKVKRFLSRIWRTRRLF